MNNSLRPIYTFLTRLIFTGMSFLFMSPTFGYLYDNRYMPFLRNPYLFSDTCRFHGFFELVGMTASSTFNTISMAPAGIGELRGQYDERQFAQALIQAGLATDPLGVAGGLLDAKSDPWRTQSRIEAQGGLILLRYSLYEHCFFECALPFMRLHTNGHFLFPRTTQMTVSDFDLIDETRRSMNTLAGLTQSSTTEFGMGDMDVAFRYGNSWDYTLKFKKIDAGARLGVYLPTGKRRNFADPTSIPFAGDGHFGIYGAVDLDLELKEDIDAGLYGYIVKRFPRTQLQRMPSWSEPINYGTLWGPCRVNPGFTFAIAPYVQKEALRGGLGIRFQYLFMHHMQDTLRDQRINPTVPARLADAELSTPWTTDVLTVGVFYDFNRVFTGSTYMPVVYGVWDIPVGFRSIGVSRTYRIALGVELNF